MVALQLWLHSHPSQLGNWEAPYVSRFATNGGVCPVTFETCPPQHELALKGKDREHEQEECHQFGLPGHRDLGIFKGCHRMNSFFGTTLPSCASLPSCLYSRCLVWGSLGDQNSGPLPQTQPYEGHLGPWLSHMGPTCPRVFYPKISVEPHNTPCQMLGNSSKLIPFKAVLFTHK